MLQILNAESGDTDDFGSVATNGSNTFTATTASKLRGDYGYEAAFDGSNYHAQGYYEVQPFELHADLHYGMRFKLKTGYSHTDGETLTIMDILDGGTSNNVRAAFAVYRDGSNYYLQTDQLNPLQSGGANIPIDVGTEYWLELRYLEGTGDGAIEWWVNNTKENELTGLTIGGTDRVEVGSTGYPSQLAIPVSGDSIYIDDVTVNDERTGPNPRYAVLRGTVIRSKRLYTSVRM